MSAKKKIYLFCTFGMSTSMLAQNMQDVADGHGLPVEVKAFPLRTMDDVIAEHHPDCALLGPQVRDQFETTKARLAEQDLPCGLIPQEAYGMVDGESVLKMAVKLIKANNK